MPRRAVNTKRLIGTAGAPWAMEQLEGRMLLTAFSWTPEEVYLAELVNRARANPQAEGARLAIDLTAGLTAGELARLISQEPLALNEFLTRAARAHSLDMAQRDFFDHVNPEGLDPTDRAQDQGYTGTAGENIAAGYETVDAVHTAWLQSLGHRKNVFSLHETFDADFHYDEFGPGFAFTDIGPFFKYYSEEFGVQDTPLHRFVLGVTYTDTDADSFYSIGEGLQDVRINVATLAEPWTIIGTYTTDAAGNYQIPLDAGSYVITFTKLTSNLSKVVYFSVGDQNVKIDARASEFGAPDDPSFRAIYGHPLQSSSNGNGRIAVSTINQHGEPIALQQNLAGNDWSGYVLSAQTGSPAVHGQVVSWTDPKDGLLYAAAAGADGVILYKQDANGTWSYRNLTAETSGTNVPGGQLVILVGTDGISRLAGLAGSGDLLLYAQTGAGGAGAYTWSFTNLAQSHLGPQGQAMPALVGDIIGYVTSWNGLNVAGLDAQGQIHSVWWAPGLELWQTTNLSDITGAPAFQGGLTAYLTSWDGINIAGITADGSVSVTWWVPSFGGVWATNNLTAQFNGPTLQPSSVTSYVTSWGGLNIAGLDQSGHVMVYWWAPVLTETGWQVTDLGSQVSGAPLLEGRLFGMATPTGTLNLFGFTGDGNIERYHWSVGGNWLAEDVTAMVQG